MNRTTYQILLVLIVLIFNITMQSQELLPGYILLNNDTVRGMVADQSIRRNQNECLFYETDGISKKYSPVEIGGWGTSEIHYRSVPILVKNKEDIYFAKVLVKGYADLLLFTGNNDLERFFIRDKDNQYFEITDPDQPKNDGLTKGKLIYLFENDPQLREKIYKSKLDKYHLAQITADYHDLYCLDGICEIFIQPKLKASFHGAVLAGLSQASLSFPESPKHNVDNPYPKSVSPISGVRFEVIFGETHNTFGLRTELLFQKNEFRGDDVLFEMSSMRFPVYAVFYLGNKKNMEVFGGFFGTWHHKIHTQGGYLVNQLPLHYIYSISGKAKNLGITTGIGHSFMLSKNLKLNLSGKFSSSFNNMKMRYPVQKIKNGYIHLDEKINYTINYIDFVIGFGF
jgi:hypothetical protein